MAIEITITADDIANSIAHGDVGLGAILDCLEREWGEDLYSELCEDLLDHTVSGIRRGRVIRALRKVLDLSPDAHAPVSPIF